MERILSEDLYQIGLVIELLIKRYGQERAGSVLEIAGRKIRSGKWRHYVKPGTQFLVDPKL